jgi:Protein of unknown function (DUF4242)
VAAYLVELYLSRAAARTLEDAVAGVRAAARALSKEGFDIRFLRSTFIPGDETCFLVFDAATPELVEEAASRAAIPFERVVEAVELEHAHH